MDVIESERNGTLDGERIEQLGAQGLLAEVVGFETDEVAREARGACISTYRNTAFIDFTSGIAVQALGHNYPEVVAAITEQAQRVTHVSDTMRHLPQLELAEWIRALFRGIVPGPDWSLLFMNSGSESIDSAAKLALKVTGRSKFIAFEGAFHGRTLFATALSCSKRAQWEPYAPFLNAVSTYVLRAPSPRAAGFADSVEALLEERGSEVAALFMEAQQGEGGFVQMRRDDAARIQALARRHGVLLICDEIQSGWGRTGRWFAFESLGLAPDMVVFGKSVGGGLPLAGVAAPRSLMERWQPGEHGTTFGGNPIACAAGLAALRIIERDGLVARAALVGEGLCKRLLKWVGRFGVTDVRGAGLMVGLELRDASGLPDYRRCDAVKAHARDSGLLILTCGAKIGNPTADNSTLRLLPPLNISEDILEEGLAILEASLRAVPPSGPAA